MTRPPVKKDRILVESTKPGATPSKVAALVGTDPEYVYRVCNDAGILISEPVKMRNQGVIKMGTRKGGYRRLNVPPSIIRAAGLLSEKSVAFTVEGGKIVIERVKP